MHADVDVWEGLCHILSPARGVRCLLALSCRARVHCRYFFRVLRVGMNLRSAVIAAVYRKAIAVSITSRQASSTGELVNVMSTGVLARVHAVGGCHTCPASLPLKQADGLRVHESLCHPR